MRSNYLAPTPGAQRGRMGSGGVGERGGFEILVNDESEITYSKNESRAARPNSAIAPEMLPRPARAWKLRAHEKK